MDQLRTSQILLYFLPCLSMWVCAHVPDGEWRSEVNVGQLSTLVFEAQPLTELMLIWLSTLGSKLRHLPGFTLFP